MGTPTSKGRTSRPEAEAANSTPRGELSRVDLERALEIELRHVRVLLREAAANYVSALEADIERVVQAIRDNDRPSRAQQAELWEVLDRIRALKVKPEKGRRRDLKRIDRLVGEFVEWADRWIEER